MPREIYIRVRGLPKKTSEGILEKTVLQSPQLPTSDEWIECVHYPVCPDAKNCDGYGRIKVRKGKKFFHKCEAYLAEEGRPN